MIIKRNIDFIKKCFLFFSCIYQVISTVILIILFLQVNKPNRLCTISIIVGDIILLLIQAGVLLSGKFNKSSPGSERMSVFSRTMQSCSSVLDRIRAALNSTVENPSLDKTRSQVSKIESNCELSYRDFDSFVTSIQHLKGILDYPYEYQGVNNVLYVRSTCINYLFPKFKQYFDRILCKIEDLFIKDKFPTVDQLIDRLGDDFAFAIMGAKFIVNTTIYSEYTKDLQERILMLSEFPVSSISCESHRNACNKIRKLLVEGMYYVDGYRYTKILNNMYHKIVTSECISDIRCEDDFYKIKNVSKQIEALEKLFIMSTLRYHKIYLYNMPRIDLACSIMKSLTKNSNPSIDKSVIAAAHKMKESWNIPIPSDFYKVENSQEIINGIFEKTIIGCGVIDDGKTVIDRVLVDGQPINTVILNKKIYPITYDQKVENSGRLQEIVYKETFDSLNAEELQVDDTRSMFFMSSFTSSMGNIIPQLSKMGDIRLEYSKEIYKYMYQCYVRLDEMSNNPVDFFRKYRLDQNETSRCYIFFERFLLNFSAELIAFSPIVSPNVPIDKEKLLSLLDNYSLNRIIRRMVINSRIICCFPDLLGFYSEDIKNRIVELASLRLPV